MIGRLVLTRHSYFQDFPRVQQCPSCSFGGYKLPLNLEVPLIPSSDFSQVDSRYMRTSRRYSAMQLERWLSEPEVNYIKHGVFSYVLTEDANSKTLI